MAHLMEGNGIKTENQNIEKHRIELPKAEPCCEGSLKDPRNITKILLLPKLSTKSERGILRSKTCMVDGFRIIDACQQHKVKYLKYAGSLEVLAVYKDINGIAFAVDKNDYSEAFKNMYLGINGCRIVFYDPGKSLNSTSHPSVRRASAGVNIGALTGIFDGLHMRPAAATVMHLATDIGTDVDFGGGLSAKCCINATEIVVKSTLYTADIALCAPLPPVPDFREYEQINEVEISGKIYKPKLWEGDFNSIEIGWEVLMFNQDGELKAGKIHGLMYYDKNLKLYNVIQIVGTGSDTSFGKKGDSGSCVYLCTRSTSDDLSAIGMVSSKVSDGDLVLTNVVCLGVVLPELVKNLPSSLKVPGCLSKDQGLPDGVDLSEGLNFHGSVAEVPNLDCHESDSGETALKPGGSEDFGVDEELSLSSECTEESNCHDLDSGLSLASGVSKWK